MNSPPAFPPATPATSQMMRLTMSGTIFGLPTHVCINKNRGPAQYGRALSSHGQAIHQSEKREHRKFIAMRSAMHKSQYRPDQPLIGLRCENVEQLPNLLAAANERVTDRPQEYSLALREFVPSPRCMLCTRAPNLYSKKSAKIRDRISARLIFARSKRSAEVLLERFVQPRP